MTTVPFHFDTIDDARVPLSAIVGGASSSPHVPGPRAAGGGEAVFADTPVDRTDGHAVSPVAGCQAIAEVRYRDRVKVAGRVRSVRVAPQYDAPVLELELDDGTAAISAVFLGRRQLAGIGVGSKLLLEGTVGLHKQRLALLNPVYELRLGTNGNG